MWRSDTITGQNLTTNNSCDSKFHNVIMNRKKGWYRHDWRWLLQLNWQFPANFLVLTTNESTIIEILIIKEISKPLTALSQPHYSSPVMLQVLVGGLKNAEMENFYLFNIKAKGHEGHLHCSANSNNSTRLLTKAIYYRVTIAKCSIQPKCDWI